MTQEQKERLAREYAENEYKIGDAAYDKAMANLIKRVYLDALDARDEEVEELKKTSDDALQSWSEQYEELRQKLLKENKYSSQLASQVIELRAELKKAKNPWRDAKTDPPKEGQDVFAHVPHPLGGDYCKLTYLGNYRWSQDEGDWTTEFTDSTVHWMQIPSVKGGNV